MADRLLVATLLVLVSLPAVAGKNLYLEQVRQSKPDAKMLQESREKLQNPPPEPIKEPLAVPPFHRVSASYTGSTGVLCGVCHKNPPHRKHEEKRSFLNFHTTFIACETCHWRPDNVQLDYRSIKVTDEPEVDVDPDARKPLIKTGFRIAPFYKETPITVVSNHRFAQKTARQWEDANDESKVALRARLHAPLVKDKIECMDCHQEKNSLLNLKSLGATQEQQHAFVYNPIAIYIDKRDIDKNTKPMHLTDLLE